MPSNFDLAIPYVLRNEGGYVNNASDPGGATNYGISIRWLKAQGNDVGDFDHDGDISPSDIKNISKDQAIALYKSFWWDKFGFSRFEFQPLATKLFDGAVNMGVKQAVKLLQQVAVARGTQAASFVDGVIGAGTLNVVNAMASSNGLGLMLDYVGIEEGFYNKLADTHPNFEQFRKGWINRASEIYMPVS